MPSLSRHLGINLSMEFRTYSYMNTRHHIRQLIGFATFTCCLLVTVHAQTTSVDRSTTFRQLLAMPAPTPRVAEAVVESGDAARQHPQKFFDFDKAPPDNAPIEDLLDYWERWADTRGGPNPSDTVKQRLLEACVADVDKLPRLLPLLSQSEAAATQVKELYDKSQSDQQLDEYQLNKVRKWLVFNSKYFLTELVALANKVKDNDKGGYVNNVESLSALTRVDWAIAEPLLQSLSNSSQRRSAALALTLLYKQSQSTKDTDAEEKYRGRLQAIVADRDAPGSARDTAIGVLSLTEWSGRDDWYLALLSDDTLRQCRDGSYLFNPLSTLFNRDPEKWIPVMARLVESKDRAVQQAAASCLVHYATGHPRRDAILPVLRWLSDPDWLDIKGSQRAWFMQKMDQLEIPESVPGLIWIVENEDSNRIWAARTLAHYKDPRAVPALKKALALVESEDHRVYIIEGLLASGGISETEQVDALEAFATKLTTPEGREEVERYRSYGDERLPISVSIGRFLARKNDAQESLVSAVLARAENLKKKDPAVAQALLEVAHKWQSRLVDLDLVNRIANGDADANTIVGALDRRAKLRETVAPEMQALVGIRGPAQGIAAVLIDDTVLAQNILGAENQPEQVALLACARLVQMPLPVEQVGPLMKSKNQLLALAAERYLLAEDSKVAQELLWAHHPNEAFVTGWGENDPLMTGDFDAIGKMEEKFRGELFKENPPLEIIALVANYQQYSRVLRVYADKVVYTHYEDPARYRERVITKEELSTFKQFVSSNHLAELGPQLRYCHNNCSTSEFLVITKTKSRRVFSRQGTDGWETLLSSFDDLGRGDGATIHYNLEMEIKGLEVLYADESLTVRNAWQQGTDVRIFVERQQTPEEIEEWNKPRDSNFEDDETAREETRRREYALYNALFSWRLVENGKAGTVASQPPPFSTPAEFRFDIDNNEFPSHLNNHMSQAIAGDTIVLASNFDGLWKKQAGGKAVRVSGEGAYADPVVSADGQWIVAAKTDSDWAKPNFIIRLNLKSGREYRVNLESAEQFETISYLPQRDRVLLRRAKDDDTFSRGKRVGPDQPEYYLLDAATGRTQLVTGVFTPLQQVDRRFLQPTTKPNEFWAAIPDRVKNQTEVGRYNLKEFSFQPLLVIPQINFDSMSMWVDEAGAKLYVVYEGQLLRLPLRTAL